MGMMTGFSAILILTQFASAIAAGAIALVAWNKRAKPGSLPLALLMLFVAVWGSSAGAKILAKQEFQPLWQAVEIFGAGVSSVLYLIFILEYTRQEKLIRRAALHVLWLIPLACAVLIYSYQSHFPFWAPPKAEHFVFLTFLLYYYALRLIATFLLARAILRLSSSSHAQSWVLTIGAIAPWSINIVYAVIAPSESLSANGLALHPLAYTLSGMVLGWGILRYRILEIVPLARNLVLEHLRDAIITIDSQNRIVDLNPAAQSLLGIERENAFGQTLDNILLPVHPLRQIILNSAIRQKIHIPLPFDRYYEAETIPITEKHGQKRGWLIVLHNITEQKQAEQNLLNSKKILDDILKMAPFPLSVTRLTDGKILYANPIATEFYELQGNNLTELNELRFYDAPNKRFELIHQLRTTDRLDGIELRMKTARGKPLWVIASFRKITYQGQECILSAQMDISERKQVEEELRKDRAKLKLIFDYAGLGIRMTDRYGRYQFVNDRWAAMLGLKPEKLVGQEEAMFLHPNHIPFNREQHRALVEREIDHYHLENQYINSQGECFWGEITVSPTLNDDGQVESTIGFILDITKRKQAEFTLRETERRFREILENIELLAVMLDTEGNLTFCNQHFLQITGWEQEEALGKNWFETFVHSGRNARKEFSRAIQHGLIVSRHENNLRTRLGEERIISWTNIILKDENNRSVGMASLGLDITERRRAHEAEREQRILAETLTHTAQILTSSLNLNQTLNLILEQVGQVVPHDAANISLIHGDYVEYLGSRRYENFSLPPSAVEKLRFKYKEIASLRKMYLTKRPMVIPNTLNDPAWAKIPEAMWIKSYVGTPIIIKNKVVGFLSLDSAVPNFFNESHAQRLETFSMQAAIAIENARLFGKVQQALNERRKAQSSLRRANKRLEAKITEIEQLQAQLREQAIRDPLTGLYNRRYLDETLEREIARAQRDDLPVGILMLDIDHFKQVNDTYGHKAGDLLLKSLADILLRESRRADIACRYGGEEFCIILPVTQLLIARQRAEAWRKQFAEFSIQYKHHTIQATVSIGIASYPEHGTSGEDILRAADSALYAAKQAGRNRVEIAPLPTV